jgi:hypothetical protein
VRSNFPCPHEGQYHERLTPATIVHTYPQFEQRVSTIKPPPATTCTRLRRAGIFGVPINRRLSRFPRRTVVRCLRTAWRKFVEPLRELSPYVDSTRCLVVVAAPRQREDVLCLRREATIERANCGVPMPGELVERLAGFAEILANNEETLDESLCLIHDFRRVDVLVVNAHAIANALSCGINVSGLARDTHLASASSMISGSAVSAAASTDSKLSALGLRHTSVIQMLLSEENIGLDARSPYGKPRYSQRCRIPA